MDVAKFMPGDTVYHVETNEKYTVHEVIDGAAQGLGNIFLYLLNKEGATAFTALEEKYLHRYSWHRRLLRLETKFYMD